MNKVEFKDVEIGNRFVYKNAEYKKIKDFKVSCCKTVNACLVDNAKELVKIKESEEVETYPNE